MNHLEFTEFSNLWLIANEKSANGKIVSEAVMSSIFDDLKEYPLDWIKKALSIHSKKSQFAPTVFNIVELINDRTGGKHIGAEEAWAIALLSFDEIRSVVWTKEIFEAKVLVQSIYDSGDKIGARMAFKEAYSRIMSTAGPVKWFLTPGNDKAQVADVVLQAVEMGRLPRGSDLKYRLDAHETTPQKLIEEAHERTGKVTAIAKLALIKSILLDEQDNGIAEREERRLAFEKKRASIVERAMLRLDEEIDYA